MDDERAYVAECIWIDAVAAKRLRALADAEGCSMRAWVEQAIRDVWEWEYGVDEQAQKQPEEASQP